MATEIERKFLLANDEWRALQADRLGIRDGLIAVENGRKVRVRITDHHATIAVKGARDGLRRAEFEYGIPLADANELLANHCHGRVVEKTRYFVSYAGFAWEVDEYGGQLAGIVIAELELPTSETEFPRPPWLGVEVTHDERYRKSNLFRGRMP
ncbi:CYTH domain-containing protein [Chelatococcus reniformis]|uniref:Adenylate cyclase n=1 Tax=Chelatococcus reniformis TaxID=1494448 RepID=A0A916ULV7_9HYPH|nr:CYTH domain-containing protein [Chelatococcus reniformis]GGC77311.1 adenylate cyclase [Chelatococcus reniformis]